MHTNLQQKIDSILKTSKLLSLQNGGAPTVPTVKTTVKKSDSLGIGKIVRAKLMPNLNSDKITPDEIKLLQKQNYSKSVFDINYPLLSKNRFDENGYPRYYVTPVQINGESWYVCQEWYDRSRPRLISWLMAHKID